MYKEISQTSYLVIVNEKIYRGNRRALRVINECPLPDPETMPLHSREASTTLTPVNDNVPLNGYLPQREGPVVMHDTPSDGVVS